MRRRSFIAALPIAAAGSPPGRPFAGCFRSERTRGASCAPIAEISGGGRRAFRAARCACGRPTLRCELCLEVCGHGMFRCGRNRSSDCHPDGHRDAQTRRFRGRCRRCGQRLPGIPGADECGSRGRLFLPWYGNPKLAKVVSLAGSGRSPKNLSLDTVRARAKNGVIPAHGTISVSDAGCTRCLVDAASALRQVEVGGTLSAGHSSVQKAACRCRRSSVFISNAIWRRSCAPNRAWKRRRMPCTPMHPPAVRRTRRRIPQSGFGTHVPHAGRGWPRCFFMKGRSREPSMPISSASAAGCRMRTCVNITQSGANRW